MANTNGTFNGVSDRYNGITVNSQEETCAIEDFLLKLTDSLTKWENDKKRCVWFNVHMTDSKWIPILVENGFKFHHTRGDFLLMYKWLPKDSKSNLPPACHTNLGVGGMVFNDKNQILVVSENYINYPHWKLPGGYVERGEDIKDAAIREVKEETDIDTVFESMITFRHTHNMGFCNSDIYVVVKLRATSEIIEKSDIEIKACKWMDVDEFLTHPHVHEFNRFLVTQAQDLERRKLKLNLEKSTLKIKDFTREMTSLILEDLSQL